MQLEKQVHNSARGLPECFIFEVGLGFENLMIVGKAFENLVVHDFKLLYHLPNDGSDKIA